jgi:hypothetical protein
VVRYFIVLVAPDAAAYSSFYTSMMDRVFGTVNETGEDFPWRVRIAPLPLAQPE